MNELKREYWSETLVCITGKVKIDRREIAAIVELSEPRKWNTTIVRNGLDIHLKSGSIFTVTDWDVNTIANLYLVESPVEGVRTTPYSRYNKGGKAWPLDESHTTMFREGKAPESEEE